MRSLRRSASSRNRIGPFAEKERRNVKKKVSFALCTALMLCSMSVAALGGCGYAGYKGYKHYINKKRGYAA